MARKLLKFVRDTTAPTLTTVAFSSNNANTVWAKVSDVVTLTFTSSEAVNSVIVSIAGTNQTVVQLTPTTFSVAYTLVSGDSSGEIPFTVNAKDRNGVAAATVLVTTGAEIVTFDKTAPTLSSATRTNDTTLAVLLSELGITASITKANAGGFVVARTGTPGTTYAVSGIAPGGTNATVVLTVATVAASSAQGVTVTYASGGNGTVSDRASNLLATNATGVLVAAW